MFFIKFKKKFHFFCCLIFFIYVFYLIFKNESVAIKDKVFFFDNTRAKDLNKSFYTIVEYTKIGGGQKFCNLVLNDEISKPFKGDQRFVKVFLERENLNHQKKRYHYLDNCGFKNCFFTCDKNVVDDADALLFHYGDFEGDADKNKERFKKLLENRRSNQIWMLWDDEAAITKSKYDNFKFNWTITFHQQSEVYHFAYGGYVRGSSVKTTEFNEFMKLIKQQYEYRKNSVLWFVSNCNNKQRLDFGKKLAEHFSITINGKCTQNIRIEKPLETKLNIDSNHCARESKCEEDYLSSNKFYLAFESINCSDYITEKFWRTLSYGLIPVVVQPSKISYERIAPPNSFIHAQDFNYNYKLLADYLDQVSNNFDLYLKYFKWKFEYTSYYKAEDVEMFRLCQLCTKLNTETNSIFYNSLSNWLSYQCGKD